MSKKIILMVIALLAIVAGVPAQAQNLSLEIDGQLVAGPGELTSVKFLPGTLQFEVVSVFQDIRCVRSDEAQPTGNSRLILDQVNSSFEPEAEYSIALPASGGSIALDAANGVLRMTTSSVPSEQLDCTRVRNAFWASDFENVFSVNAATPASPFPTGNTLSIPFTVKNETLTTIATNIVVDFTWSATDPLGQTVTAVDPPTFTPSTGVTPLAGGDSRWTIDILWPGESRTIMVAYQLDAAVPPDTLITTEVFNVEASDREGVDSIAVGSPAPVVSEVTTGEADLSISKTKVAGPDPVTAAGQVLEYEVVIENTGTFSLTGVVVTDTFPNGDQETLTNPVESITADGEIEPGENWTFFASYTVEQLDIDAGFAGDPIVNTASVETLEVPGPTSATEETAVDAQRSQVVRYSTTAATANAAGQIIPYQLEIENTGQVSITVSAVSATLPDNSSASLTGPNESIQPPNGKIDPGEIWTYETQYSVTQTDLDTKNNLTSVSSTSTSVEPGVLRFAEVTVEKDSAVELTKRITANQNYDSVGDVIEYAFDVENTGTQTLSGPVSVSDQLIASVTCPDLSQVGNGDSDLQPGEIAVCTASITVDQGHLDAGSIVNTATATVDGVTSAQSTATANAIQTPEITLTKTVSSITVVNTGTVVSTYANVGDVINYEFNVQNTGNQTLPGPVSVSDDMTSDEACPALTGIGDNDSDFDPGESVVCTASYTVDQTDIDNGSVVNQATASAGSTTSNVSTATADANQNNAVIVEASSSVDLGTNGTLEAGDTINYSFTIQNLGNTTLTGLSLSANDPDVTITGTLGSLAPGTTDAAAFSGTYVIESGDIAAGSFSVIFNASSNQGASDNVSETTTL